LLFSIVLATYEKLFIFYAQLSAYTVGTGPMDPAGEAQHMMT
jgi:hypothetical protein